MIPVLYNAWAALVTQLVHVPQLEVAAPLAEVLHKFAMAARHGDAILYGILQKAPVSWLVQLAASTDL